MVSNNILPDSRLKDDTLGTVMADFEFEEFEFDSRSGLFVPVKRKYRLEMQPIFCANCGKLDGYIPRGLMAWVCFLCDPCSETHGAQASLLDKPDKSFWDAVAHEMFLRYGRALTQQELIQLVERKELPRGLQLLERESPFVLWEK